MSTVNADLNDITNTITANGNDINYEVIYTSGNLYTPDMNILYNSAAGIDWNSQGQYIISTAEGTGRKNKI